MANVSDSSSHRRDQIANFAEILRNAEARQLVFEAIYRGKQAVKTIREVAATTGYDTKRIATIAHPLAGEKLFDQSRVFDKVVGKATTAYKKIPFVTRNKEKILRLARNKGALENFHTKTNPKIKTKVALSKGQRITVKAPFRVQVKFIRSEEIGEFAKAKTVKSLSGLSPARLSESKTKKGILSLLGEAKTPKDWGGENNDIFTDRVTLAGKKQRAAFALKGPAKKGPLVPGKMG
ncbi:MAG: hypothetical protein AB7O50_12320, partial [Pseudolabrys sp.]